MADDITDTEGLRLIAWSLEGGNMQMAEECRRAADEIERLRAAGDALAHTLSVQSEWTCCADGWFGPCDCPPDAASRPTNGRVATALDTWKEVRRG